MHGVKKTREKEGPKNKIRTNCAAIVENDDGFGLPSDSRLEIMPTDNVLHEKVE
jgi:hypothetical protein